MTIRHFCIAASLGASLSGAAARAQSQAVCLTPESSPASQVESLSSFLDQVDTLVDLHDGTSRAALGFRIENACIKKFGASRMQSLIREGVTQAVRCLQGLEGPGAQESLGRLLQLLSDRAHPPRLLCAEKRRSWEGTAAIASLPGDRGHPFLSFSPGANQKADSELRGLLLHELLHNAGYAHGVSVERPLACQRCCTLPVPRTGTSASYDPAQQEERVAACEICRRGFESVDSADYVRAMIRFDRTVQNGWAAETAEGWVDRKGLRAESALLWTEALAVNPFTAPLSYGLLEAFAERGWTPSADAEWVEILKVQMQSPALAGLRSPAGQMARAWIAVLEAHPEEAEKQLAAVALPRLKSKKPDPTLATLYEKRIQIASKICELYDARGRDAKTPAERTRAKDSSLRVYTRFIEK